MRQDKLVLSQNVVVVVENHGSLLRKLLEQSDALAVDPDHLQAALEVRSICACACWRPRPRRIREHEFFLRCAEFFAKSECIHRGRRLPRISTEPS